MNDEGVGIAGWLLADLALVLAIVFLAFTPAALSDDPELPDPTPTAAPEPTIAPPVILDIGCEATEESTGSIDVECEPHTGGGEIARYRWKAERGSLITPEQSTSARAAFDGAGALRLSVSNESGEHTTAFAVLPRPAAAPQSSEAYTDFRFDQIVIEGASRSTVGWADIRGAGVRERLNKNQEAEALGNDWSSTGDVEAFLRAKRDQGLRIALVETFAHSYEGNGFDVALAEKVNNVFHDGLLEAGMGDIFLNAQSPRKDWFGDYLNRRLNEGEVRINVFFVCPSDNAPCR